MTKLYSSAMKTAVSIPDAIFQAADRLARRRNVSRSELYAEALRQYLAAVDRQDVTRRLDEVYADIDQDTDPFLHEAARHAMDRTEW